MFALIRENKGFLALSEMIVVLVIVGILAAMAIPSFRGCGKEQVEPEVYRIWVIF